jgi:hypothetical protein
LSSYASLGIAQTWDPSLDVIHPILADPHIARRALHNLVGQLEIAEDAFGIGEKASVPLRGFFHVVATNDKLLDLVKLMNAQQAADVSTGAARLAPEAG